VGGPLGELLDLYLLRVGLGGLLATALLRAAGRQAGRCEAGRQGGRDGVLFKVCGRGFVPRQPDRPNTEQCANVWRQQHAEKVA
jgi:hypothetical protein